MIRVRIGVLVPAGNPTVEPEFYRMAPAGVTIHFARLDSGAGAPGTPEAMERRTLGYLDALPVAVRTLADLRPAVGHGRRPRLARSVPAYFTSV